MKKLIILLLIISTNVIADVSTGDAIKADLINKILSVEIPGKESYSAFVLGGGTIGQVQSMQRVSQIDGVNWITCTQVGTGYYHCTPHSSLAGNINCTGTVAEGLSNRGISIKMDTPIQVRTSYPQLDQDAATDFTINCNVVTPSVKTIKDIIIEKGFVF